MAGLWCDNFCTYGEGNPGRLNMLLGDVWAEATINVFYPSTDDPRTGTHSLFCTGAAADSRLRRVYGGPLGTVGQKITLKIGQLPDTNDLFAPIQFRDAGNLPQLSLIIQSTGILSARTGGFAGVLLAETSAPVIFAGSRHNIEARIYVHDSAGTLEVRVDGVTVINASGATAATEVNETSQVALMNFGLSNPNIGPSYLSDVVAWDTTGTTTNDFINDQRVFTLFPNQDTAVDAWLPDSVGQTLFSRINQATPDADTTYARGDNALDVMELEHEALPSGVSSISFVQLTAMARKTDAGDCNLLQSLVSGSDFADGAEKVLTTGYAYYRDIIEVDPATGAPFAREDLDATLMRFERTV